MIRRMWYRVSGAVERRMMAAIVMGDRDKRLRFTAIKSLAVWLADHDCKELGRLLLDEACVRRSKVRGATPGVPKLP